MAHFDRFDICEAWYVYAVDHHNGMGSREYEVFGRLERLHFRPSLSVRERCYDGLTENGKEIYEQRAKASSS